MGSIIEREISDYLLLKNGDSGVHEGFAWTSNNGSGYWTVCKDGEQLARGKESDQSVRKLAILDWVGQFMMGQNSVSPLPFGPQE